MFDGYCVFVFFNVVVVEDVYFDNGVGNIWWQVQGCVVDVGSFFVEDGMQKFFFWCYWVFVFWCDFVDKNVVWMKFGVDIDDVGFVEIFQCFFGNVWNIVGDFFWIKFGIMCYYFEFFKVDGCEDIVGDDVFG